MQEERESGTYTLLFELVETVRIEVGSLGVHTFDAGWYAYTGSALGTGGFSRIDRHERVAAGQHDVRHWHVDYFGGHSAATLQGVETAAGRDVECTIARALGDGPVAGFGASDCECRSHLAYRPTEAALREAVNTAYARVAEE